MKINEMYSKRDFFSKTANKTDLTCVCKLVLCLYRLFVHVWSHFEAF